MMALILIEGGRLAAFAFAANLESVRKAVSVAKCVGFYLEQRGNAWVTLPVEIYVHGQHLYSLGV